MRSKFIITQAFQKSVHISPLLFVAVFSLEAAPVISAIYVSITARPLPVLMGIISGLVPFLIAMLLFTAYFHKNRVTTEAIANDKLSGKSLHGYAGVITAFLMFLVLMLSAWQAYANLSLFSVENAVMQPGVTFLIYTLWALVAMVLSIILMGGLSTFFAFGLYPASPLAYPRYFFKILGALFRRISVSILMLAALLIGTFAFRLLDNTIVSYLDYLFYDSLTARLVYILIAALLEAFILNIIIQLTRGLLEDIGFTNKRPLRADTDIQPEVVFKDTPDQVPVSEGRTFSKHSVPAVLKTLIPPVVLAAMLLVLVRIFVPITGSDAAETYEEIILSHIASGDVMLLDPEQLDLASYNYRKAYSMVKSFQGYIKTILVEQDPSHVALKFEASDDFNTAAAYDAANPYYYLFKGYWFESNKNPTEGLRYYRISREVEPLLGDAGFACCRLEKEINDADALEKSVDSIICFGNYGEVYNSIKTYTPKYLETLLDEFEKTREYLFERLVVSALEKSHANDVKGMHEDVAIMLKAEPESPNLIFLQAISAMAYRPEQSTYPVAEAAFDKLTGMLPDNDNILEYYGQMLMTSKNYEKAARLYESLYGKYPDNPALGEQYAYSLMAGSRDDEAIMVCDKVLTAYPDDWLCHYIKAVSLLKSNDCEGSLGSIIEFAANSDTEEYKMSYDTFLNSYCLAYSLVTMHPEAMAALDYLPGDSPIKPYILGVTAWRDKDLSKGLEYIEEVLEINPLLGLAWYTKASILFEQSKTDENIPMTELESFFIKAASLQPSSIETWFSLGNFYKARGGHDEEALRAYRRVVDLVPYSDHAHDYYGVVYHSLVEIDRLKADEFHREGE